MRSIGLMGYARSGKDTAGRHLVAEHGYTRIGFADGVRDSLLALDPIVEAYAGNRGGYPKEIFLGTCRLSEIVRQHGWERAKDEYPEVRELLQRHGTDAVRGVIGDDTWVWLALRKIGDARQDETPVAVTDVRFPNEAAVLRNLGFTLVWVDRPGCEPVNGHASETSVSAADADITVKNYGTTDDLNALISACTR